MGLMNRRALLALVGLMAVAGSAWGWNARDLRNARAGADLNGANLRNANLARANLSRAHLESANLGGAHLQGVHLSGVRCNSATRWPRGFVHPRCQP